MTITTRRCGFSKIPNRLAVVMVESSSSSLVSALESVFVYVSVCAASYVGFVHLAGELLPPDGVGRFTFPQ